MKVFNKEYILDELHKQFERTREMCDIKWQKALEVENSESNKMEPNRKKTKQENTDLKEYNNQVVALAKISSMVIAVENSGIPANDEQESETDELI